jgi:hypothetical protein
MSLRLLAATGAVTAAALALPLTASARPDYLFDAGAAGTGGAAPAASTESVALQPDPPVVVPRADGGADTWLGVAVAGGTLLAGAAAGAAGTRAVARHHAVRP